MTDENNFSRQLELGSPALVFSSGSSGPELINMSLQRFLIDIKCRKSVQYQVEINIGTNKKRVRSIDYA